jgi:hypothetical protein
LPSPTPSIKQELPDTDGILAWKTANCGSFNNPIEIDGERSWPTDFFAVDIVDAFARIDTAKAA